MLNICRAQGINTVGDLCGWTRHEIITARNLGRKSLNELEAFMERKHLHWGMWESPSYLEHREKHRSRYNH